MQQSKWPVAIGYCRVSTDKQKQSGLGLGDQERSIKAFCEAHGLTLAEPMFVETESGKSSERPELLKALSLARRKKGVLVVATLSRLSRSVEFVANLMNQRVPFACADAPDDEPLILHIKASVNEDEARKISKRTKDALAELKRRNYWSEKKQRFVQIGAAGIRNLTDDGREKGAATMRKRAAAGREPLLPQITALRTEGLSVRAIADRVGTSPMTVSRILRTTLLGGMKPQRSTTAA